MTLNGNTTLDEIRRVYEEKRNGVLSLARDNSSIDVFYREGIIDAVSTNLVSNQLGQCFLREGYLEAGELEALLSKSKRQKVALGEAALRYQLMSVVELSEVLRVQVIELLIHA